MKRILTIALLSAALMGGLSASAQDNNQQKPAAEQSTKAAKGTATVVFATDIHCESCKKKIESNIPYEKGVKDLSVDIAKKEVAITYRTDKTNTEKLLAALNKLGYKSFIKEEKQ